MISAWPQIGMIKAIKLKKNWFYFSSVDLSQLLTKEEIPQIYTAMKTNRLTKDSTAVSNLIEKIEKEDIRSSEDPKDVWLSYALFLATNGSKFSHFLWNSGFPISRW